jgi:hypothetical protein
LKINQAFYHSGTILNNLETIFSSRGSNEPFLYLADFVGFIFQRVKTHKTDLCRGKDSVKLKNIELRGIDNLTKECFENVLKINRAGLIKYLDLWEIMPTEQNVRLAAFS